MNTFTHPNISRWDSVARIVLAIALLVPVFLLGNDEVIHNEQVIGLALLAPWLTFTAMMKWDPIYGLINVLIKPFGGKPGTGSLSRPALGH